MPLRRRLIIAIAALCFILLAAFAISFLQTVSAPMIGEWHPQTELVKSGIRMELRRLAILPWSARNPQHFEGIPAPDPTPPPGEHYLCARVGIEIDGVPIQEVDDDVLKSVGPLVVTYDDERLATHGGGACIRVPRRASLII